MEGPRTRPVRDQLARAEQAYPPGRQSAAVGPAEPETLQLPSTASSGRKGTRARAGRRYRRLVFLNPLPFGSFCIRSFRSPCRRLFKEANDLLRNCFTGCHQRDFIPIYRRPVKESSGERNPSLPNMNPFDRETGSNFKVRPGEPSRASADRKSVTAAAGCAGSSIAAGEGSPGEA